MEKSFFTKDGTAQGVAKHRLIETIANPKVRIINDPYAERFVFGSSIKLMGHKLNVWVTQKLIPGFHEHLIARTRFIDDLIQKSVGNGVEQYVILGAEYDSRAYRLVLPSSLKVFEVDQSEVQKRKRSKLPEEVPNLKNITYVAADFASQSLTKLLRDSGFDQSKATVFTHEGVSQYITKEALASIIQEVATLTQKANSILFISYVSKLLMTNPEACCGEGYLNAKKRIRFVTYGAEKIGEPWVSFYTAEELESILNQNGYEVKESVTLKELNSQYFTPAGRTLPDSQLLELEHFLVAKS